MTFRLTDIKVMIHHETDREVLVSIDGDAEQSVWLPKSSIEFEQPIVIGRAQIITLPQPLAEDRGLV